MKTFLSAGLKDNPIVFLFSDTQIKEESFLEDINNILNSGDVPNIYAQDELDKVGFQIDSLALWLVDTLKAINQPGETFSQSEMELNSSIWKPF